MRNLLIPAFVLGLPLSASATAGDVDSGLKEDAFVGAFNVLDVTGPKKGESLCYRCRYGGRPVVSIFTRSIDDNLAKLVKQVDEQVGKNKDQQLSAFVVLLTDDPDAAEPKLAELAKKNGIEHTPLTIFDGKVGPPDYKISEDAEVTVLMWKDNRVKFNRGLEKGKLDEKTVKDVVENTGKLVK
ncbi:MAG: hypothetical protein KY476_14860 [Planctomycetes bacterium]|nr:hypothetical protein [Planctomycetota bacterium]